MSQTLPVSQFRNMGSIGISIQTSHGPATNARTAYMTLTGYISFSLLSAIIKDSGPAMRKAQISVNKYLHFRSWLNWGSFAGAQVVCFFVHLPCIAYSRACHCALCVVAFQFLGQNNKIFHTFRFSSILSIFQIIELRNIDLCPFLRREPWLTWIRHRSVCLSLDTWSL